MPLDMPRAVLFCGYCRRTKAALSSKKKNGFGRLLLIRVEANDEILMLADLNTRSPLKSDERRYATADTRTDRRPSARCIQKHAYKCLAKTGGRRK